VNGITYYILNYFVKMYQPGLRTAFFIHFSCYCQYISIVNEVQIQTKANLDIKLNVLRIHHSVYCSSYRLHANQILPKLSTPYKRLSGTV
jgi:hypothetical protein